ncbi:MAG TPA: hypothetical protein VML94_01050 [Thermoplasmata archaeon]|nr:hypothetical protein [Thermoplasmata archaeon]
MASSPSTPTTIPRTGWTPEPGLLLPDEEASLEARLERVRQEKADALKDPGPTWKEWFCYTAAKWWLFLGVYVVVLSWEIVLLYPTSNVPLYETLPLIVVTIYLDLLLWRYLWYRPHGEEPSRSTGERGFRRSLLRPVQYGRWTPEWAEIRAGRMVPSVGGGPDPKEFL